MSLSDDVFGAENASPINSFPGPSQGRTSTPQEPIEPGTIPPKRLSSTQFERIYREGKVARGVYCRIMATPGSGLVGFAVARSIGCHAARNRAKRRFREAMRSQRMDIQSRLDYVVSIQSNAVNADFISIEEDLKKLTDTINQRWANASECS